MKRHFLFTIFCLIPFLAFSQKKSIDGFLDIPFGSDSATVKAAIIVKGGVRDSLSKKDELIYDNFSLSGRNCAYVMFDFVDNKVYQAYFVFTDFNENGVFNYYDNFSSDIAGVYGTGEMTNNFGHFNNTANIKRLKSGNAACKTIWESKNKNTISLKFQALNNGIQVVLEYQSGTLWDLNASKRRSDL